MRITSVLIFLCLAQSVHNLRVVVTFMDAHTAAGALAPDWTVRVKQYGRRMVLFIPDSDGLDNVTRALTSDFIAQNVTVVDIEEDTMIASTELLVSAASLMVQGASSPAAPADPTGPFWNLFNSTYGLNLPMTGNRSLGQGSIVGVLDSGLAANTGFFHRVAQGYDFVSDPNISMDGDGRDANPTDPGDAGPACPISSWHGTKVTSVLAGSYAGFYSIVPEVTVVPSRVLGLCASGYASDLTDAIVWSAGGTINGVPPNGNPVRIISLSLSGEAACPSYLQSAVSLAVSLGVVIIAAAGNDASNASMFFPANCVGVVVIAASTKEGTMATYSNWGKIVSMAAPGGDASNPIPVLTPGLGIQFSIGTSFAVPHVTGLLALLTPPSNNNVTSNVYLLAIQQRILYHMTWNASHPCVGCGAGLATYYNSTRFYASFANYGCDSSQLEAEIYAPSFGSYQDNCGSADYPCLSNQYHQELRTPSGEYAGTCAPCGYVCVFDVNDNMACTTGGGCTTNQYMASCGHGILSCVACTPCSPGQGWVEGCDGGSLNLICYACPAGTYSPGGLYPNCQTCGAGTYSGASAASCTSCNIGYYSSAGSTAATACLPCNSPPTGYYWAGTGASATTCTSQTVCQNTPQSGAYFCSPGGPGYSTCTVCPCTAPPIGYYWANAGFTSPTSCTGVTPCTNPPGAGGIFVSAGGVGYNTCTVGTCPVGQYTSASGMTVCSICAAGTYASATGQSTCKACANGQWSALGSAACNACTNTPSAGSIFTSDGGTATGCTTLPCSGGTYTATAGTTACNICGVGTFSASGATVCTACTAGTYASATSLSTCSNCPTGTYNPTTAMTVCQNCPAGTYNPTTAVTVCQNCPAGTYNPTTAVTVCQNCPAGRYNTVPGSSACFTCTSNAAAISTTACGCNAGYYYSALYDTPYNSNFYTYQGQCPSFQGVCQIGVYSAGNWYYGFMGYCCDANMVPTGSTFLSTANTNPIQTIVSANGKYFAGVQENDYTAAFFDTSGALVYKVDSLDYTPLPLSSCGSNAMVGAHGGFGNGMDLQSLYCGQFCVQCQAGSYSIGSALSCTPCAPGTYAPTTGLSACSACAVGKYAGTTQLTNCQLCGSGTYMTQSGGSVCVACSGNPSYSHFIGTGVNATNGCQWKCNAGYAYDQISACIACGTLTYSLTGDNVCSFCKNAPVGSLYQTVSAWPNATCPWYCDGNNGYFYNGTNCTLNQAVAAVQTASSTTTHLSAIAASPTTLPASTTALVTPPTSARLTTTLSTSTTSVSPATSNTGSSTTSVFPPTSNTGSPTTSVFPSTSNTGSPTTSVFPPTSNTGSPTTSIAKSTTASFSPTTSTGVATTSTASSTTTTRTSTTISTASSTTSTASSTTTTRTSATTISTASPAAALLPPPSSTTPVPTAAGGGSSTAAAVGGVIGGVALVGAFGAIAYQFGAFTVTKVAASAARSSTADVMLLRKIKL